MNLFVKNFLFPLTVFLSVLVIVFSSNNNKIINSNATYTLKAYKNTVALYNGEEIVRLYKEIVLNTLPAKDVKNFKQGISFTSPVLAEAYIQDFE